MMKRHLLVLLLVVLSATRAAAQTPLVIDFEHYPGPDGRLGTPDDVPSPGCGHGRVADLSVQFSSMGMTFTTGALYSTDWFQPSQPCNHFLSGFEAANPTVTLSIPVYSISIDSYSGETAVLSAYDAADNLIAFDILYHPGSSSLFFGTLRVATTRPIARFTVLPAGCAAPLGCSGFLHLDNLRLFQTVTMSPFGFVETPVDGGTGVTGAVPFTGWALDDVGISRVTICRNATAGEVAPVDLNCGGMAQIFIGSGVFIDGARPDVQGVYPTMPMSGRAGWGFMVLTNTLPNQGNGTFQFFMHATDLEGHTRLLGTRTLTCDNANATKPFGAIDTPTQGGTVSGSQFVNFGWALTPLPKTIPTDGSTTQVFVDGTAVGPLWYNHFRADIAALFPGLANSGGAVGFRVIDTTTLANGLHTISWGVADNGGAVEGIGSRFFTVSNPAAPVTAAAGSAQSIHESSRTEAGAEAAAIAAARRGNTPIVGRRGWDPGAPWRLFPTGGAGRAVIRGEEIDRLELWIGEQAGTFLTGYVRIGDAYAPLPVGSQLDARTGWFTWAPGVGFVGTYDLVFVRWAGEHALARQDVRVILSPKGRSHIGVQLEIDTPRARQAVDQPFLLGGWAADLDAAAGTGIDTLHVWAYPLAGGPPVFQGATQYGGTRPDVAAVHGDQFRDAGFGLIVQGLARGSYDLAIFPWSNVIGSFAPAKTIRLDVR